MVTVTVTVTVTREGGPAAAALVPGGRGGSSLPVPRHRNGGSDSAWQSRCWREPRRGPAGAT